MNLEKYKRWMIANGLSSTTQKAYINNISSFLTFSNEKITRESIESYIVFLKEEKKLSAQAINQKRATIKSYLDFLDIAIKIPKAQKIIDKIPDTISRVELEKKIIPFIHMEFFDAPEKPEAIIRLLFSCGLRPSELILLKRKQCNFDNKEWKFYRPKVKKEDILFLDDDLILALRRYFLIEEEYKNAFNIGCSGIRRITSKIQKKFPEIKMRPTLLRHSCATSLLEGGMSLIDIRDTLGHVKLSSTEKYLKVDISKRKENFLKIRNKN